MASGFPCSQAVQGRRDSNPEPPVLETGALPVELRPSARLSVSAARAGSRKRRHYTHAVPRRRRSPLGGLFLILAAAFVAVAVLAALAGGTAWVIAAASGVLALWMAEQAFRALR